MRPQLAPRAAASRPVASRTLTLALALAACGGSDDGPTALSAAASIAGVYPLRTYDGAPLPLVVGTDPVEGTLELTSGHVTLREDGTFRESITYKLTPPAGAVIVDSLGSSGRYATTAAGTQIMFTFPEGDVVTAQFENNTTITVVGEVTFVYKR